MGVAAHKHGVREHAHIGGGWKGVAELRLQSHAARNNYMQLDAMKCNPNWGNNAPILPLADVLLPQEGSHGDTEFTSSQTSA